MLQSRLISKGRLEEAAASLRRLRKKNVPEQVIQNEVNILSSVNGNEGKGTWKEVFSGTNRVRTYKKQTADTSN